MVGMIKQKQPGMPTSVVTSNTYKQGSMKSLKCFIINTIFLLIITFSSISWGELIEGINRPKPPFKVIFNNDCTNIGSCKSPFNPEGFEPQSEDVPRFLQASVDEVSDIGVDVLCFAPGMGWVPWWKSQVVPDHYQWFKNRMKEKGYEPKLNFIHQYVEQGGDVVKVVVDRCKEKRLPILISYRLNDLHHLENPNRPEICQFYVEHPE